MPGDGAGAVLVCPRIRLLKMRKIQGRKSCAKEGREDGQEQTDEKRATRKGGRARTRRSDDDEQGILKWQRGT